MIRKPCQWEYTQNKKETQVSNMETLTNIISIATTYSFFIEKESLLNKKSQIIRK
jgi:hypothetical protein